MLISYNNKKSIFEEEDISYIYSIKCENNNINETKETWQLYKLASDIGISNDNLVDIINKYFGIHDFQIYESSKCCNGIKKINFLHENNSMYVTIIHEKLNGNKQKFFLNLNTLIEYMNKKYLK